MNIPGIPGSPYPVHPPGIGPDTRTRTEQRPAAPAQIPAPTAPARRDPVATATPAAAPVPVQAPPGTDPELWSVLNAEERAHFARLGAMGPLTYGRVLSGQMQPPTPDVRGGRLDLKV